MGSAYWQEYVDFIKSRGNIEEVLIIAAEDGALYASSNANDFYLRTYKATIMQEDGNEREETVNEASNIVKLLKGQACAQGLRINQMKKMQITRNFIDEQTGLTCVYGKMTMGGACVANAGKVILIATYSELKQHTAAQCNEIIQLMAMYLNKSTWPEGHEAAGGGGGGGGPPGGWQAQLDKALVARGNIAEALILDASTGDVLASTADFKLMEYDAQIAQEDGTDVTERVSELKNVRQLMTTRSKPSQGLRIKQVKYQIIKSFDEETSTCFSVYGKKAMGGIAIVTTGKVIIIATFDEKKNHAAPLCNDNVQTLAKYLKDSMK